MAVHWYADYNASPDVLSKAHEKLKEKFILYTEVFWGKRLIKTKKFKACNEGGTRPGQWARGDTYMQRIMPVSCYFTGWAKKK